MRRGFTVRILVLLEIAALLCGLAGDVAYGDEIVRARAGIADLRQSAFADGALYTLCGEWEFRSGSSKAGYFAIEETADDFAAQGYFKRFDVAVFRLVVETGQPNRSFGILFRDLSGASRVWLNGKLCLDFGRLSDLPEGLTTRVIGGVAGYMASDSSGKIEIVHETGDRDFRHWNLVKIPPLIGYQESISEKILVDSALQFFVMGAIFFILVYHLAFFCRRRKDLFNLFFCLFILDLGLRILLVDNLRIVYSILSVPTFVHARLVGLFVFPLAPLFMAFVVLFFPEDGKIGVVKAFAAVSALFLVGSLFVPMEYRFEVYEWYYPVVFAGVVYTMFVLVFACLRGRANAVPLTLGFLVFAAAALHDVMMVRRLVAWKDNFAVFGVLAFLVFHSVVINSRVSNALRNVESLTLQLEEHRGRLEKMVEKRTRQLKKANLKLEELAHRDGLTKLYNRRFFDLRLEREWRRLIRNGKPLAIVLSDVDFFKAYNDRYGHQQGDECLKSIARIMQAHTNRPGDFAARYGGEEFVLVLPETDLAGVMHIAESVRIEIESSGIEHGDSPFGRVTLSAGISAVVPTREGSPADLVRAADALLYEAKQKGRNRVEPSVLDGDRPEHG